MLMPAPLSSMTSFRRPGLVPATQATWMLTVCAALHTVTLLKPDGHAAPTVALAG